MNLYERFSVALPMREFLQQFGNPAHQSRWQSTYDAVQLTPDQTTLLAAFKREMHVLVLAGAWCGDCSGQCPILDRFATVAPVIKVRYLDNAEHADVQQALSINGGKRVPVAVFFSEDGYEVHRFGERTLSRYRQMMQQSAGNECPTGIGKDPLLPLVTQEWLNEVERVQWLLRLSSRLRQKHGD